MKGKNKTKNINKIPIAIRPKEEIQYCQESKTIRGNTEYIV